ncbi:MAG: DUF1385 domain-containing protein [Dehalococcoidia bacterium]
MAQQSYVYGGQAVIEGVMIRGRHVYSVAVRHPDGGIRTLLKPVPAWSTSRWRRVPFLRGTLVLGETLAIGMKALMYSGQVAAAEGDDEQPIPWWAMIMTLAISLGFGILLFFMAPLFVAHGLVDRFVDNAIVSNFVEGVVRLVIFFIYLMLISMMPDIKRVFAYHAAEHMSVHAHEHRLPLEPENVRQFPAAHPRCGTAFLLTVLIVSLFVFTLLGSPDWPWLISSRIVLLPLIAGISYEIIRFNARHEGNSLVRLTALPGLWLQNITTRPPEDDQIEVAIAAMNAAIQGDAEAEAQPA